ncbi:unnamed protein product [Peronospora destructor]|uniref:Uncharacterized protein n=1 Tax=Peronospora destructor TaxID=86335 RepID=A0AAV0V8W7_9STRA|nr:unnamed protein product [Peronospora destructor]
MVTDFKCASETTTVIVTASATICKNAEDNKAEGWHKLKVTFQASPDAMLLGHPQMSPAWRLFLFGNGSPTHHLGLLTGSPTEVDVLGMLSVWLRNSCGERLGYAASWINMEDVDAVFKDTKIPIGKNIRQHKTELYRDMKSVFCGHSNELEKAFGTPGPFWGRSYLFWNRGRPVTYIYEVFSPALEKHMGKVLLSTTPTSSNVE